MITTRMRSVLVVTAILLVGSTALPAEQRKSDGPTGFDTAKAVQHFYLLKNGGAMEVSAKDEKDSATITAIQQQLTSQAKAFEKGNFDSAIESRDKTPEGISTIRKLRKEITFEVVPMDTGAALRMLSINEQARSAIHDFMRSQIEEHKTGDPTRLEQ